MLQRYDYLVSSPILVKARPFDDDLSVYHEKLSMFAKPILIKNQKLRVSINVPRITVTFVL